MKYILILIAFLGVSNSAFSAELYFELGVGLTKNEWGLPEIDLQVPLGRVVFGVEAKDNWLVELEHISSIPQDETGNGLNVLWISKRIYF